MKRLIILLSLTVIMGVVASGSAFAGLSGDNYCGVKQNICIDGQLWEVDVTKCEQESFGGSAEICVDMAFAYDAAKNKLDYIADITLDYDGGGCDDTDFFLAFNATSFKTLTHEARFKTDKDGKKDEIKFKFADKGACP